MPARHHANSDELCRRMAAHCDTAILSFSLGKDSIAAWLQLRKHFKRIVPVYFYYVPDLQFIERELEYFEAIFGEHIHQYPDPVLVHVMRHLLFQPPERTQLFSGLPKCLTRQKCFDDMREQLGCDAWTADGIRQSESIGRRVLIKKLGSALPTEKRFFPVFDWDDRRTEREMKASGVALPVIYRHMRKSFEGAALDQLVAIKREWPEDYARILEWMPLCEAELWRREYAERGKEMGCSDSGSQSSYQGHDEHASG